MSLQGVSLQGVSLQGVSLQGERVLLRAYLRNADRSPYTPTYELLVKAARQQALAGATVLKGVFGFGSRGLIQPSHWALTEHAPIILEIIDAAERIEEFLAGPVHQHMLHGTITLERASVMMYRHRRQDQPNQFHLPGTPRPRWTVPQIPTRSTMSIRENGILLRIFLGESDRFEHQPLYEAIVRKARALGLAGATVLRGIEGFGANSIVHKAKLLEMSADLPIVIEIVDVEEKIQLLLPHLETMVAEGLITQEHVTILMYRAP